ncbi:hypothetical protein HPB47_017462 [Ixodes persulcatus]|uniref:Uncharacterized protein n=1 Tax=Ixodes persulcatus TaxID=34615 RepID=A0AC60QP57_IXOPE|nr:hypothetical protein HPB47_017462 [Ixodes persulcatus]
MAAAPVAAVAAPPSIIIRPHTNPFAPLMDLEHAQHEEGKLLDLSSNVRVILTAKHGQKRARGTLSFVSTAASTRNVMSTNQTRGVEIETAPTPSDASTQDSTLEESDWQRVTYRRKKNSTLASASSSYGRPMYQHTVILKPIKPCRIMDEHFIKIDEAIIRHISTYLKIDKQHDLPKFLTRYLNRSNQIAVDAAETRVRDALVTIDQLPIKGQVVPFQAYETIRHGQIRGIIRHAGGMLATELMQNLHCRKCEILSARPLGDNGTALITFLGNSLPYRLGLRSLTVPVFPFKAKILVCDTCNKMGHRKEQCPNQSSPSRSSSRRQRNSRRKSTLSPPSLPEQRPKATATSRNFYAGPSSLPVAPTNEDSSKLTFASVVAAINARTSQQSALTPPSALSKTSTPRATPQTNNEELHQTATALPVTSLQPPPSGEHQLPQADLDQRLAQLEQTILQKVQQAIGNAIERCVKTALEKQGRLARTSVSAETGCVSRRSRAPAFAVLSFTQSQLRRCSSKPAQMFAGMFRYPVAHLPPATKHPARGRVGLLTNSTVIQWNCRTLRKKKADVRLQSTHAGRHTLAMLGHDITNLPDLPQLSPPWEHIMLTDSTPLPQNMPPEQVERRRTFVKKHTK